MKYLKKICVVIFVLICFCMILLVFYGLIDVYDVPRVDMDKVTEVFKQDTNMNYYYHQLNEVQKEDYQKIYYALTTFQENVPLKTTSSDEVSLILENVMNDHPELYYVGYEYSYHVEDDHDILMFYPEFLMTQEDVQKMYENIKSETQSIVEKAKMGKTDLDKMEILYRYLIENVEYQENKDDQIMTGALLGKKSVCAGYARAYQYLLNQIGIGATYVSGETRDKVEGENNSHAWVMIRVGDDYYYSDPTWGDNIEKDMEHACMFYFLMDSDEMLKCYEPDGKYEKTNKDELDYFKENGIYMMTYDKKVLSRAVSLGKKNKSKVAEVKCANKRVYQKILNQLKNGRLAYEVLSENACWKDQTYYSFDENMLMIELYYK